MITTGALIGRAVSLEISEPWDFGSVHGTGPLAAEIEGVDGEAVLLKLQSRYHYLDAEFGHLVATARHMGAPLDAALAGGAVPVNLVPVSTRADGTEWRQATASWRGWHLIGTLRLVWST